MSDYICEPLGNQHDRSQFDCGVPVLNDYLAKYAKQDVKRKASAVFVLAERMRNSNTACLASLESGTLPD
jgi:hypothetical protein